MQFADASAVRWDDVVTVMGERGAASRCWCQFFRLPNADWRRTDVASRRADLRRQVETTPPPGVLGYLDGAPVGWSAVAPRADDARVGRERVAGALPEADGLWSLTCFVVRVGWRRQGIASGLLDAAVDLARRDGARVIEAYPVDTAVRPGTQAGNLYRGTVQMFTAAGFAEVARPSPARPVMRLTVNARRAAT